MKPGLRETLRADVYRYRGSSSAKALADAWFREPGFRFTWYLRKVAFYAQYKRGLGIFAYLYNRVMLNHYRFRYGYDISPSTTIGPGFYIGHFGGLVVSPFAIIGSNVNVAKGATIGATSRGPRQGAPTLEDRVWIGANATVVGKITLGQEALIAPGAYVNFDVPSRAVVLGNPGRVVAHSGSAGYLNNVRPENAGVSA